MKFPSDHVFLADYYMCFMFFYKTDSTQSDVLEVKFYAYMEFICLLNFAKLLLLICYIFSCFDSIYILKYLNFNFRYIIFFCPYDLVSQGYSFLPVQLLAAGMKEVTRTWKIVGGVTHANSYYKNGWIVMIAIGWARGNINSAYS